MSNPNLYQVAGNHYVSEYQHWDLVTRAMKNRYLEGNATKYLARWRKKNGLVDLEKGAHYLEKLMTEVHQEKRIVPMFFTGEELQMALAVEEILNFCRINEIVGREKELMLLIGTWRRYSDLKTAFEILQVVIFEEKQKAYSETPAVNPDLPQT